MRNQLSLILLLAGVLLPGRSAAQQPDDEYFHPYAEPVEAPRVLVTDSALFYRAVQHASDLFGEAAAFTLPQVAFKRRGDDYRHTPTRCEGLDVGSRYGTLLRLLGGREALPDEGGTGRDYRFDTGEPIRPYRASAHFSGRNYLLGARFTADRSWGKGWRIAAAADLRTGRDLRIKGVFTEALSAGVRAVKHWDAGPTLTLLAAAPLSVRGLRLSSVEEAYTLTGDALYNPAWGFQAGKVRNSRIRREAVPLVAAAWQQALAARITLDVHLAAEAGIERYSALGWYDARTPMPDHYRYLPSFTGDRATEEAWLHAKSDYTQIRWDELILQNRMRGGEAAYALEDRVARPWRLTGEAAVRIRHSERMTLRAGVRFRREATRSYRQMRDLLGADALIDIDQYLTDDAAFGSLLENDLRHPRRIIREGNRFGYHYTLAAWQADLFAAADYRADRLRADAALALGSAAVRRTGHYEKELFPGSGSYGPSERIGFTPYTLRLRAGWAFSPRSYLEAAAWLSASMPDAADLFYQPQYNNRTIENPRPEQTRGATLAYRLTGAQWQAEATLFCIARLDGCETRRYYDDMAACYCDLAVTGIGTLGCGIEAAAQVQLGSRWQLSGALTAGRYRYIRNPRLTIRSDRDNSLIDTDAASYMGDCRPGGIPAFAGSLRASYYAPSGWGLRLSAGYAGGRYVEPAYTRRTARIARQAGITPEAFDRITRQERLADASMLGLSLFKSFRLGASQLTLTLTADNLTGSTFYYDGYESLRVRTLRAGSQTFREPQPTRYLPAYPQCFYATAGYRF